MRARPAGRTAAAGIDRGTRSDGAVLPGERLWAFFHGESPPCKASRPLYRKESKNFKF